MNNAIRHDSPFASATALPKVDSITRILLKKRVKATDLLHSYDETENEYSPIINKCGCKLAEDYRSYTTADCVWTTA